MNANPYFLLILLFATSCDPDPVNSPPLHPEEEKMIGVWHEIADKGLVLDSLGGTVIDSIDVSAIYEFKDDYTFTSQNEVYTKSTHGTWEFDSTYTICYIYPVEDSAPTAYRQDRWEITHDSLIMEVGHTFDYIFPDGVIGAVYVKRKFEKIP
jgi:hypothetical protein